MKVETAFVGGAEIALTHIPGPACGKVHLVWGHGWGHSANALLPLAVSFERLASSTLIDFPGFGRSPSPPKVWGTEDYADAVAEWLRRCSAAHLVWIGHSFGCRIGLQIASRYPDLLSTMILIAAAGLPRTRRLPDHVRVHARGFAFRLGRRFVPEGPALERLRAHLGSPDYVAAGPMRPILSKVVREDLSLVARGVGCPTLLVYGRDDTDTPPEIGERLRKLIPHARLVVLDRLDHNSILVEGRHQIATQIHKTLQVLS